MEATQLQKEWVVPAGCRRRAKAEEWLGDVLKEWGVRSASTSRWLAPAADTLEREDDLVLFAQYDRLLLLFSIEIWKSGQRVYGIDDWLG